MQINEIQVIIDVVKDNHDSSDTRANLFIAHAEKVISDYFMLNIYSPA